MNRPISLHQISKYQETCASQQSVSNSAPSNPTQPKPQSDSPKVHVPKDFRDWQALTLLECTVLLPARLPFLAFCLFCWFLLLGYQFYGYHPSPNGGLSPIGDPASYGFAFMLVLGYLGCIILTFAAFIFDLTVSGRLHRNMSEAFKAGLSAFCWIAILLASLPTIYFYGNTEIKQILGELRYQVLLIPTEKYNLDLETYNKAHILRSIQHGLPVDTQYQCIEYPCTPYSARQDVTALIVAASRNDQPMVEKLLKLGANVNFKTKYGNTALMAAAGNGNYELVKRLVEAGADINEKNYFGRSALSLAIQEKTTRKPFLLEPVKTASYLIQQGADTNVPGYGIDQLLIVAAMKTGDEILVKALLDKGMDINQNKLKIIENGYDDPNHSQTTPPLMEAIFEERDDWTEMLLNRGADVNITFGSSSDTPLSFLVADAHSHISRHEWDAYHKDLIRIKLLLKYGADIHKPIYGDMEIIELVKGTKELNELYTLLKPYDVGKAAK